ncbi:MAG: radical SAM protein [Promethearchaeota archaeon]
MVHQIYRRNLDKCWNCGFCTETVSCPSPQVCIGCQACYLACYREAIEPIEQKNKPEITIIVDEQPVSVPSQVTIKTALETLGIRFSRFPHSTDIFAPCQTGGCFSCLVLVDGKILRSCHMPVKAGQQVKTKLPKDFIPHRIVGWYSPHPVGGVGTPWSAKNFGRSRFSYIEVACFTAGCNLRCKTCQNFDTTYNSRAPAVTPHEASETLTRLRKRYRVNRLAISGGEPTLNRRWLTQFFSELKSLNPDSDARLHLDTNASILTPDYIDELVLAGITDIGPDLKAVQLATYQIITGITDPSLARQYLETSWAAVKYIADHYYPDQIFMGVGLPYNAAFFSSSDQKETELHEWGARLSAIDDHIQVCILDYRPTFRRLDITRPSVEEIRHVKQLLEGIGLKTVIAQTKLGHLPPIQPAPDRLKHQ